MIHENTKRPWNCNSKGAKKNTKLLNNNIINSNKKIKGRFNKARLPAPTAVLTRLNIKHDKMNSGGYLVICCPFHKNGAEKHPSLNLHHVSGHFKCHSCDEKGSDILEFFMRVTKIPFIEAVKELGAWEDQ